MRALSTCLQGGSSVLALRGSFACCKSPSVSGVGTCATYRDSWQLWLTTYYGGRVPPPPRGHESACNTRRTRAPHDCAPRERTSRSSEKMTKVLVTGADGFVGREATVALCQAGYEVRAAVRRPDPSLEALGSETVAVGDISVGTDWTAALQGVDLILHLAGRAHITRDRSPDPLADFRTVNVGGTTGLARQAARCRVRRLVYVSSVKVNGELTN